MKQSVIFFFLMTHFIVWNVTLSSQGTNMYRQGMGQSTKTKE